MTNTNTTPTNTAKTLVLSDWIKIGGYVLGILAVIFHFGGMTKPAPVNVTMPVVPVKQQTSPEVVKLYQEVDALKKELAELKVQKEVTVPVPVEQPVVEPVKEPVKEPVVESVKEQVEEPVVEDPNREVEWQYNEEDAKVLAKKLNRPLGLAFATTQCPICEQVKLNTYKDRTVWHTMHAKYVPLWVFVFDNPDTQRTAFEYKIVKYPRFVVDRKANGHVDKVFMPSTDPQEFLRQLQ